MTLSPLFVIFAAAAWAVAGCLRIYRLARYFQLEGYDSKRFRQWLAKNPGEKRYRTLLWIVVLIALGIFGAILVSSNADLANLSVLIVLIQSFSLLAALVTIFTRPVDKEIKQRFTPTQRAMRLIGTAFVVEVLIQLVPLVVLWLFGNSLGSALIGLIAGALGVVLASWLLPVANVIMWPVEEAFRRYYLRLAKQHLVRSGATVIAITGSYGKTSTKHYLHHILDGRYRVLMTPKSYNTLLGVSRVINDILAKDVSYDYFLVEAGAYIPGEIARICQLVEPRISMVVTVGPMHLERFGSIENVVKAKYEIIEALPPDGLGVFNGDDPRVRGMAERGYPQNRILVTREGAADARLSATNVRMTAEGLDFDVRDNQTGDERSMHAPLYGEHNVTNMLMAMAVARSLGMSLGEIALRVATLQPAEHRLNRRVMPDGTILIDDAYSANPVGTQTALAVLAMQNDNPDARRIVISSGMFELGPISAQENRLLGERIAKVATDVILIGADQTKPVVDGLKAAAFPPDHLHVVDTLTDAVAVYRPLLRAGDALLVLTDLPDTYA